LLNSQHPHGLFKPWGFLLAEKGGNYNEQEAENDNFTSQQRRQDGSPGKTPGDVVSATDGKNKGQKTPVRLRARSNPVDATIEGYRRQKKPSNANYLKEIYESYWNRKLDSDPGTADILYESNRKAFEQARGGVHETKPGEAPGRTGYGVGTVPEEEGRTADHAIDEEYSRAVESGDVETAKGTWGGSRPPPSPGGRSDRGAHR